MTSSGNFHSDLQLAIILTFGLYLFREAFDAIIFMKKVLYCCMKVLVHCHWLCRHLASLLVH